MFFRVLLGNSSGNSTSGERELDSCAGRSRR
jgi:hypothetical protein